MAGQTSKHKINIGLTSLILIFIILCLATFSLLSLSSARGDQSLAARSARAVTEYYRADAEGEKWLKQADAILQKEMTKKAMDQEEIQALAKKMALELGCDGDEETGFVSTDISMDRGQALHIDLALTGDENRYEVRSWYVYDSGNYEIDDFMPVWEVRTAGVKSRKNGNDNGRKSNGGNGTSYTGCGTECSGYISGSWYAFFI